MDFHRLAKALNPLTGEVNNIDLITGSCKWGVIIRQKVKSALKADVLDAGKLAERKDLSDFDKN